MNKLILGMVMVGMLGCGEAPGLEKQESAIAWPGPADPPESFYVNGPKLLYGAYGYPMTGSTEFPVKGYTYLRLWATNLGQSSRTLGGTWTFQVGPMTDTTADRHALTCNTTVIYAEYNFSSPPDPTPPTPATGFTGNQGYWYNTAPFNCFAWKKTQSFGWVRYSITVPYSGLIVYEARDYVSPFGGIGVNVKMNSPSFTGSWNQEFFRPAP